MAVIKSPVVLLILMFLWTSTRGDDQVSCGLKESCILPCSFQRGTDVVIHWTLMTAGIPHIHSFYENQDQFEHQDPRYRGRTSLFKDQISRGNASLQLTGVRVEDQGKYNCYTSTIDGVAKESFIHLKADAPVRKVKLEKVGNRITCSSEGICPKPLLTWSTRPPSNVTFKDNTEVQGSEQQLYTIRSSLTVSDSDAELDYICSVSTRRNSRRVTMFKTTSITGLSHNEISIPCTASNTSLTGFSLTCRFNNSQIILNWTSTDTSVFSEEWRQKVEVESGRLTLKDLSPDEEGIYTCEVSNAEETLITTTVLRIERSPDTSINVGAIVAAVIGVLVLVLVLWIPLYKYRETICQRCQKKKRQQEKDRNQTQDQQLHPLHRRDEPEHTCNGQQEAERLTEPGTTGLQRILGTVVPTHHINGAV